MGNYFQDLEVISFLVFLEVFTDSSFYFKRTKARAEASLYSVTNINFADSSTGGWGCYSNSAVLQLPLTVTLRNAWGRSELVGLENQITFLFTFHLTFKLLSQALILKDSLLLDVF